MAEEAGASRGLVRSMLVIGSAQGIRILLNLVRMKGVALLLGPAGVGLLSIFASLKDTATLGAGVGIGTSGVRELAAARRDDATLARVRRVLLVALLAQGALAMAAVWLLRERLAVWLLDDAGYATEIGLVGIAVLLSLLSLSRDALLQGMRRIGDLGRVTALGTLAGTVAALAAVWFLGEDGVIWYVLVQPLAMLLVGFHYTRRLPKPEASWPRPGELWRAWRPMVRLGAAFMTGALANMLVLLILRAWITRELGLDAAGQFAAAWAISVSYLGLLFKAFQADYYPRLSEVIEDRQTATRLMNDQSQLSLALGAPVMLLLIGTAPWVIHLLYSAEFDAAVPVLQWLMAGSIFRLAVRPLGTSFVAAARARLYSVLMLNVHALILLFFWLGLPVLGLLSAGVAFLAAYGLHFALVSFLVRRLRGFRWERLSLRLAGGHITLALALLALARVAPVAGAAAATLIALATGLAGGRVVAGKIGPEGHLASRLAAFYKVIGWPVRAVP